MMKLPFAGWMPTLKLERRSADPVDEWFTVEPNAAAQKPDTVRSGKRGEERADPASVAAAPEWPSPGHRFVSVQKKLPPVGEKVEVWFAMDSDPQPWVMWMTESGIWNEEASVDDFYPTHWRPIKPTERAELERLEGGWVNREPDDPIPIFAYDAQIEYFLRDGYQGSWPAQMLKWGHLENPDNEIVRYRVVKP